MTKSKAQRGQPPNTPQQGKTASPSTALGTVNVSSVPCTPVRSSTGAVGLPPLPAPQPRPDSLEATARRPDGLFHAGGWRAHDTADRALHAAQARYTNGISPISLASAGFNWAMQLANAPGRRLGLARYAVENGLRLAEYGTRAWLGNSKAPAPFTPRPGDKRFAPDAWQLPPYNFLAQAQLAAEDWWDAATSDIRGLRPHHQDQVNYVARQVSDMMSPSNAPWINPRIRRSAYASGGATLRRGALNAAADFRRWINREPSPAVNEFRVGRDVAVTPGKVVFRNDLIEVIQYAPATEEVHPEPILIVPAWIMKYYILDLSPHNSLVRYLVSRGHTVFMVSWKNPDANDRNLSLDDYRRLGVMAALDTVSAVMPDRRIHSVGYCLGGTILAIAAATMARDGDNRLASISLLAAQTDFSDAGEMMRFIDDSQLAFLEDLMWDQGYLDANQMAGALETLDASNSKVARLVERYWMGAEIEWTDLLAWVEDRTRMPYRMHAEYLNSLFLENRLSAGRFAVEGRPIAIGDIDAPIFAVGTERDRLAPWHSVYKINLLAHTDVTFVLASHGHNTGIVAAGDSGRHFRMDTRTIDDRYVDAQTWVSAVQPVSGSWWPAWQSWLAASSSGMGTPPALGAPTSGRPALDPAPGRYVKMP